MSELTDRRSFPDAVPDATQRGQPRDRALLVYLVLGALVLVPGIVARANLGLDETGLAGALIAALDRHLQEIKFGSTTRFWLGVSGATTMGLLLLYPLRKLFGSSRWLSVRGWFHFHVVLGLLVPILILYHCYFHTGSTPANVALFTTLAVVASGFFGHFVYTRLSADFHATRREADDRLRGARMDLDQLSASMSRSKLLEDLEAYEPQAATSRDGLFARAGSARARRERQGDLLSRARHLIETQGPQDGWSVARCRETAARVDAALVAYFAGVDQARRRAARERLASYWRLLHLPLFCVTVIAIAIHVYKVWDMDDAAKPTVLEASIETGEAWAGRGQPQRVAPIQTRKVATSTEAAATTAPQKIVPQVDPKLVALPKPAPRPVAVPSKAAPTIETGTSRAAAGKGPDRDAIASARPVDAANGGPREPSGASTVPRPEISAEDRAALQRLGAGATLESTEQQRAAVPRAAPDPVAELASKTAQWGDTTGKLDPLALRQRLAELKANPTFDHAKTRFPITGKHTQLGCESCHKSMLKDNPRRCIDCHQKDDVHRGRRPDCADCHVTTDWDTQLRK